MIIDLKFVITYITESIVLVKINSDNTNEIQQQQLDDTLDW